MNTNGRYILVAEQILQDGLRCSDCQAYYSIVKRVYIDQLQKNPDGTPGKQETSVRTSCLCIRENDPYANPQRREATIWDVSKGTPNKKGLPF
jgi:hypothetical protein